MELELRINGIIKSLDVAPNESLMTVLRQEGYHSVKHGCETGECGACNVLVDGVPRPSCVMLAAQAGGCTLTTVESLGTARKLHPLQEAFIDTGAIQCGFCTPGMVLSAHALLKSNPDPSENEVRDALSGNLCAAPAMSSRSRRSCAPLLSCGVKPYLPSAAPVLQKTLNRGTPAALRWNMPNTARAIPTRDPLTSRPAPPQPVRTRRLRAVPPPSSAPAPPPT